VDIKDFIDSEKARKKRDEIFAILEDLNAWEGGFLLSNVFCCLLGMTHYQGGMAIAEAIFKTHSKTVEATWQKIKSGQFKP
jgi:hypothetical protein